jgi:hypothetical protein
MQLAFAAGGAALGYGLFGATTFLGMSAASWGWSAGSLLGGIIGNKNVDLPPQFGPRLSDLKVQTSTYGNAIPRAFGTVRIAGNIIWAPPITEIATTTTVESGGKGGGGGSSQDQTTYSYTADFAVAICEGPIVGIRKVWANGELINDIGDDSPILSKLGSLATILQSAIAAHNAANDSISMTVYTGTETQNPDPTIVATHGNLTPAFRGTAYVVFQDLPLAKFGNRIPNLEFEVVVNGSSTVLVPQLFYTLPNGLFVTDGGSGDEIAMRRNSVGAQYYWAVMDDLGSPSATRRVIGLFDNYSQTLVMSRTEQANLTLLSDKGLNGRAWYQEYGTGLRAISPGGKVWEFADFGDFGDGSNRMLQIYEFADENLSPEMQEETQETAPEIFLEYNHPAAGVVVIEHGNATAMDLLLPIVTGRTTNRFLDSADRIEGRVYIKSTNFSGGILSRLGYAEVGDMTNTYHLIRDYTGTGEPYGMVGRDGYLYVRSADTGFYNVVEKMDQDGNVVDSVTLTGISSSNNDAMRMVQDAFGLLYVECGTAIFRIGTGTMEIEASATLPSSNYWILPSDPFEGRGILLARGEDGYRDKVYILADSLASEAPPLSDVVTELCELSGLTSSDIDVSQLTTDLVSGYVIANRGTVRSMLEPLMGTYFFDAVESDNKIKFVKRGGAVAVTIPEDDLSAHTGAPSELPDSLRVMRKQEMELPVEINVSYLNRAIDYQVSSQPSRRLITQSKQSVTLQVPIVFTDTQAKRIADMHIFSAWVERENHEFETGREYAKYEPCDVVGVVKGGVTHNVRLTQKDEGGDGVIKWKAVADYASVYSQVSTGVAVQSDPQEVNIAVPTNIEFMDIPLLRDEDDDAGFYFAASGAIDSWRGMQLYQSTDSGVTYSSVGSLLSESTMGYTTTALGDYTGETNEIIDEANPVTVVITSGSTLASITKAQLLNQGNVALIGNEVIQFRDATLVDTDTYELTGLLRGRLGSETYMTGHVSGDRFILLNTNLRTVPQSVSLKDQALYYKPVSVGRTLAQTNPMAFTNRALRKKPLAPVHLGAGKNSAGDFTIEWTPRTRFEGTWRDGSDAPIGENTERYEVEIMLGDVVKRTISTTSRSATYTLAQQVLDFGSGRSGLNVVVYQMSDTVGRGYPAEATFSNSVAAYYWLIANVTVPGGGHLQVTEMRLYDSVGQSVINVPVTDTGPNSFSFTSPVGAGTGLATSTATSGDLSRGFDNSLTHMGWNEAVAEAAGFFIKFNFSAIGKVRVTGLKAMYGLFAPNRYMQAFTLWRSDTGTGTPDSNPAEWIAVGTKTGLVEPPANTYSEEYNF